MRVEASLRHLYGGYACVGRVYEWDDVSELQECEQLMGREWVDMEGTFHRVGDDLRSACMNASVASWCA